MPFRDKSPSKPQKSNSSHFSKRKYIHLSDSLSPSPSSLPISASSLSSVSPYATPPTSPLPFRNRPAPTPISRLLFLTTLLFGFLMGTLLSGRSISLFSSYIPKPVVVPTPNPYQHTQADPQPQPSPTVTGPRQFKSPTVDMALDFAGTKSMVTVEPREAPVQSMDPDKQVQASLSSEEGQGDDTVEENYDEKVLEDFKEQLVGEMEDLRDIWAFGGECVASG